MRSAICRALDHVTALVGGVPSTATVDPAEFSEDEFPVHCLHCGYLLRGATSGTCPECGTSYDRGKLLVSIYARGILPSGARSLTRRLAAAGWACSLGSFFAVFGFVAIHQALPTPGPLNATWQNAIPCLLWTGVACSVVTLFLELCLRPPSWKCRAVTRAARRK